MIAARIYQESMPYPYCCTSTEGPQIPYLSSLFLTPRSCHCRHQNRPLYSSATLPDTAVCLLYLAHPFAGFPGRTAELRDEWEETSFRLERLQAAVQCVDQEAERSVQAANTQVDCSLHTKLDSRQCLSFHLQSTSRHHKVFF